MQVITVWLQGTREERTVTKWRKPSGYPMDGKQNVVRLLAQVHFRC